MGCFATDITVKLDAVTASRPGTLFGSLLQQRPEPLTASRRVDTEIADSAEIAFERQLSDEMQGNEADQLTAIPFCHEQTGIVMVQLLLDATVDEITAIGITEFA